MSGLTIVLKRFVGRLACWCGLHSWRSTALGRRERDRTNFECRRCGIGVRRAGDALGFSSPNNMLTVSGGPGETA